jgi:hypothetical protein
MAVTEGSRLKIFAAAYLFLLLSAHAFHCAAQAQDTDSGYISRTVHLDEVVISAVRGGFDVQHFIKRVEEDSTFYKAFKTLRIIGYTADNDIRLLNKKGNVEASLKSITRQTRKNNCRSMEVLSESTTGDFYTRKKKYNYYTAELYASLFFTDGSICGENNIVNDGRQPQAASGSALEKHKEQLKKLIFNPGQPVAGIPVVGRKVAIFDPAIAPMYDFSITSAPYHDITCYVFTATAKPEYKDKVVVNKLVTFFDQSNFDIVARNYALSYNTFLFDFDVQMEVQLDKAEGVLVPSMIRYQGNWNVAFHKRERASFTARFYDLIIPPEVQE